jgi:hypothetical protein
MENGIETTESYEGTRSHCYPEPTVCFDGMYEAGFRALALCYTYGLKGGKRCQEERRDKPACSRECKSLTGKE